MLCTRCDAISPPGRILVPCSRYTQLTRERERVGSPSEAYVFLFFFFFLSFLANELVRLPLDRVIALGAPRTAGRAISLIPDENFSSVVVGEEEKKGLIRFVIKMSFFSFRSFFLSHLSAASS